MLIDPALRSARQATPSQRKRGIRHSRQVKTPPKACADPGSKPQPAEEEPPEADPCRHHRTTGSATTSTPGAATTRRHHAPRTPGGPERLVPHTLQAALSVPVLSSSRPPDKRVPCPAPHGSFLARSAPSYQSSAPPSAGSAEERTSRHANAVTRSRSTRGTPRKKNLKRRTHASGRRPVAVKCAELPYMPLLLTGRHSPTPQHPQSNANRTAHQCRGGPPRPVEQG